MSRGSRRSGRSRRSSGSEVAQDPGNSRPDRIGPRSPALRMPKRLPYGPRSGKERPYGGFPASGPEVSPNSRLGRRVPRGPRAGWRLGQWLTRPIEAGPLDESWVRRLAGRRRRWRRVVRSAAFALVVWIAAATVVALGPASWAPYRLHPAGTWVVLGLMAVVVVGWAGFLLAGRLPRLPETAVAARQVRLVGVPARVRDSVSGPVALAKLRLRYDQWSRPWLLTGAVVAGSILVVFLVTLIGAGIGLLSGSGSTGTRTTYSGLSSRLVTVPALTAVGLEPPRVVAAALDDAGGFTATTGVTPTGEWEISMPVAATGLKPPFGLSIQVYQVPGGSGHRALDRLGAWFDDPALSDRLPAGWTGRFEGPGPGSSLDFAAVQGHYLLWATYQPAQPGTEAQTVGFGRSVMDALDRTGIENFSRLTAP
jgi:hypothetical protein